jgi:hypothetical protein
MQEEAENQQKNDAEAAGRRLEDGWKTAGRRLEDGWKTAGKDKNRARAQ